MIESLDPPDVTVSRVTADRAYWQLRALRLKLDQLAAYWQTHLRVAEGGDTLENDNGQRLLLIARAERLLTERRLRNKRLGHLDLFGEAGWDIALDLFIARAEGRAITVTSACAGTGAPQTTALRYLQSLERKGWVDRTPAHNDARMVFVSLSDAAMAQLGDYLNRLEIS